MSVPFNSDCLQCHLRRTLALVRPLGTEEQTMAFARDLLEVYQTIPAQAGSPWLTPPTNRLLNLHYGLPIDRFRQEKEESNAFAVARYADLKDRVEKAQDRVLAGLKLAILGNYLDFAALAGQVSFEKLEEMLQSALDMELDMESYGQLCRDLEGAKNLLYLTDNAGEILFDRIFGEALAEAYPQLSITFCVRGDIANNDATRADAQAVGLSFPVIDNGNNIPGTQMDMLSREAQEAFSQADVILSKGMANVETMYGCGYNVYYAFLIKCTRFAQLFGRDMMSPMLVKERK